MQIIIKELSYTYHAQTPFEQQVLHDISLEIMPGSWLALIGRSGSGKSTLAQHLNGLYTPSTGTVQIGDRLLTSKRKRKDKQPFYEHVGMVFQYPEHQLFEETVEKDISFGPKNLGWPEAMIDTRVRRMMQQVGLPLELAERSPFQLSGGQKRRVAIAGVIVMNPKILILDEPTAGLDVQGKQAILQLLQAWQAEDEQHTIITITHQMEDVAEYADQVVVLDQGKVKWQTDPYTLFTSYAEELEQLGLELPQALQLLREVNKQRQAPIIPKSLNRNEILKQLATTLLRKGDEHGDS